MLCEDLSLKPQKYTIFRNNINLKKQCSVVKRYFKIMLFLILPENRFTLCPLLPHPKSSR